MLLKKLYIKRAIIDRRSPLDRRTPHLDSKYCGEVQRMEKIRDAAFYVIFNKMSIP